MRKKLKMKTQQIVNYRSGNKEAPRFHDGDTHGNKLLPTNEACSAGPPNGHSELRLKKRGRKAALVPSEKHLEILNAVRTETYQEIGVRYGCSRQRIAQIVRRWRDHLPLRPLRPRIPPEGCSMDKTALAKEIKNHVICFRVTAKEAHLLRQRYSHLKSINHAARHILAAVISV